MVNLKKNIAAARDQNIPDIVQNPEIVIAEEKSLMIEKEREKGLVLGADIEGISGLGQAATKKITSMMCLEENHQV